MKKTFRSFRGVLLVMSLLLGSGVASGSSTPVKIGLIDTFSPRFYLQAFVPTIEYLQKKLSDCDIRVIEISPSDFEKDILREKPDFLISSSWHYSLLSVKTGAQQIVTKKELWAKDPQYSVASVFIVRADRDDIRRIGDMKGKKAAAYSPDDFAEWRIALGVLARSGFDPDRFFSSVRFTRYKSPSVATLVKLGIVDAGILPMCDLERFINSGDFSARDFRVLDSQATEVCARSSPLYPDAVFSRLPWADMESVRQISIALLSMKEEPLQFEWLPASGFLNVTDLMKDLREGPYAYLRDMTLWGLVARHRQTAIILGLVFFFLLFHVLRANRLVRMRTQELRAQSDQRLKFEVELRKNQEKLHTLEKIVMDAF